MRNIAALQKRGKIIMSNPRNVFLPNFFISGMRHRLLNIILDAITSSSVDETKSEENNPPKPHNTETFAALKPISEITENNLITLDGYAFDTEELKEYIKDDLQNVNRNPHLIFEKNMDFSTDAKDQIKNDTRLAEYWNQWITKLKDQDSKINKDDTFKNVAAMLLDFNSTYVEGTEFDKTIARYREKLDSYINQLSIEEKNDLNNYIIQLPVKGGGYHRLKFEETFKHCAGEQYLWRFLVISRPSFACMIPDRVKNKASAHNFQLTDYEEVPRFSSLIRSPNWGSQTNSTSNIQILAALNSIDNSNAQRQRQQASVAAPTTTNMSSQTNTTSSSLPSAITRFSLQMSLNPSNQLWALHISSSTEEKHAYDENSNRNRYD
jgi:hypothetical protein